MARFHRYTRKAALLGVTLAALAGAAGQGLAEGGIPILMNEAKIVKLARPADTIVIGNPEIADASVQDATTIVLTGKGFGVTNLVVMDDTGTPIVDEQVFVSRQDSKSVRIYRRSEVQTLSCTPFCEGAYKSEAERTSEAEMNVSR
jgi:Flp pilus assembly secretin CpaC